MSDGTHLAPPRRHSLFASWCLLTGAGWAAALASFGLLITRTPLYDVLSWDFPLHPWWYTVRDVAFDGLGLVLILVPIAATVLPTTRWFARLSRPFKVLALSVLTLWVVASLPGWMGFFGGLSQGDLGLGIAIVVFGPFLLAALLVLPLLAFGGLKIQQRRMVAGAQPN
jgi:hypothetical protein